MVVFQYHFQVGYCCVSLLELWDFGRKIFSIIILDKNFNIIGETVFPEYTYNPNLMYIDEKGLYISENHYKK